MKTYSDTIKEIKRLIDEADAVFIGAGAGLSTAAGYTYSGERFDKYFSDFKKKHGFDNMYYGGFIMEKYSPEELWAFWSRYIYINRYMPIPKDTYSMLFDLVKGKDYFVLTTNVDHCFQRAGFDKKRLFYTQGDYGLFQCSEPCHQKTYDNEEIIKKMYEAEKDMKIPTELIPKCPVCGKPMAMNLRADDTFVQDEGWYEAHHRYEDFVRRHEGMKVVYLELGVGYNTPVIIKYPFWRWTAENENATYVCINLGEADAPTEIKKQSICIDGDINTVLEDLQK
ncbi:MAG: Sir2 silent information regulator family NAD-dependent deacetylase [Ruminococcaceae bacterium]|nr:Sir2 silent information regulator family NAD-dependent deacetylase [Oscillospiraceae bacterium]